LERTYIFSQNVGEKGGHQEKEKITHISLVRGVKWKLTGDSESNVFLAMEVGYPLRKRSPDVVDHKGGGNIQKFAIQIKLGGR